MYSIIYSFHRYKGFFDFFKTIINKIIQRQATYLTHNPNTQELEAGRSWISDKLGLPSKNLYKLNWKGYLLISIFSVSQSQNLKTIGRRTLQKKKIKYYAWPLIWGRQRQVNLYDFKANLINIMSSKSYLKKVSSTNWVFSVMEWLAYLGSLAHPCSCPGTAVAMVFWLARSRSSRSLTMAEEPAPLGLSEKKTLQSQLRVCQ